MSVVTPGEPDRWRWLCVVVPWGHRVDTAQLRIASSSHTAKEKQRRSPRASAIEVMSGPLAIAGLRQPGSPQAVDHTRIKLVLAAEALEEPVLGAAVLPVSLHQLQAADAARLHALDGDRATRTPRARIAGQAAPVITVRQGYDLD